MENLMMTSTASLQVGFGNDTSTIAEIYPSTPEGQWTIYAVIKYMRYVYLPIIFLLGLFGNVMTIIIMQRMAPGESIINIHFTAVAVMDTMVLSLKTLPLFLSHVLGYDVMSVHDVLCKLHTWLYTGAGTTGCWYLVCMTVHRAMSVVWPHRINVLCTRRTAVLMLTGIAVSFFGLYSHFVFGRDRVLDNNGTMHYCIETSEDYVYFLENIFVYIDILFYCFLPFLVLAVSNSVLVWKLTASVKAAGRNLTHRDSEKVQAREKEANSVTLTVIVVSSAFLVLTLPNSLFFILNYSAIFYMHNESEPTYEVAKMSLIHDVCFLLSIANAAVNFYLYCLTGRRFREKFIKVMCSCKKRRQVFP